ncbi:hypothetical protein A4X06_0g9941, partial [Tilletia controversa]
MNYNDAHHFATSYSLFGVITLDVNRASTFLSGIANFKPAKVNVPIVSGHSGVTIVPLFYQVAHGFIVSAGEQYEKCVHRIQFGGDELVKVKDGAGTATLSMVYAAAVFSGDLICALRPERRERTVSSSARKGAEELRASAPPPAYLRENSALIFGRIIPSAQDSGVSKAGIIPSAVA